MGVDAETSGNLSEREIVFQAAKDAIVRTRRALMIVTSLVAFGFFYLFWWYGSWELARIEARQAVAASIRQTNAEGNTVTGVREKDASLIAEMESSAAALRKEWDNKQLEVPLVQLKVNSADFSVGILIVGGTVLIWLLFYQRRLDGCIKRLYYLAGTDLVTGLLLEYHFVLIGSHVATRRMKSVWALLLALPALAFCFLLSDGYDSYIVWTTPVQKFAFSSAAYSTRAIVRLGLDIILAISVAWVSRKCYLEFKQIEAYVLEFADEGQVPSTPEA